MTFSGKVRANLESGFAAVGRGFWFTKYSHTCSRGAEKGGTRLGSCCCLQSSAVKCTGHLQTVEPPTPRPLGERSGTTSALNRWNPPNLPSTGHVKCRDMLLFRSCFRSGDQVSGSLTRGPVTYVFNYRWFLSFSHQTTFII